MGRRPKPLYERRVSSSALAHFPRRKSAHPGGANLGYCYCGEAICQVAGMWWHIYRRGPRKVKR